MKKKAIVTDYLKRENKYEKQREEVLRAYLEDSKKRHQNLNEKRHQSLSEKIERLF